MEKGQWVLYFPNFLKWIGLDDIDRASIKDSHTGYKKTSDFFQIWLEKNASFVLLYTTSTYRILLFGSVRQTP